jgi:transposase
MPRHTGSQQLDSPRKNRFIGAVQSHHNISRAARDHGIRQSTAQSLWQKFQDTGSTANRPRSGRPSILSAPEKAIVVDYAKENRRKPFRDIGNEITPHVSESTIRRILAEEGYHRRVARKVPYRSEAAKQKRLAWAEECVRTMSINDWHNVAWSDEAYVCLDDKAGRVWVTRQPGEELLDECCVPIVPQSPVRVMVWGIVMKGAKGPLVVLEYPGGKGGGMTAERYINQVLQGPLLKFYNSRKRNCPGFQFQQDGAAAHRAKITKHWLAKHQIPIFPHPPTSPDVSAIEPVWHILKTHLRDYQPRPYNEATLRAAILDVWAKITCAEIDQFIDRMPEVVAAVIDAKGGHTHY